MNTSKAMSPQSLLNPALGVKKILMTPRIDQSVINEIGTGAVDFAPGLRGKS
jgi:hypothetical protein